MNTNMTGLDGFQKTLHSCALDESSLTFRRVRSQFGIKRDGEGNTEFKIPLGTFHICKSIKGVSGTDVFVRRCLLQLRLAAVTQTLDQTLLPPIVT